MRLSILTSLLLPATMIASFFGMNTKHTPIVGHQYDFLIVAGLAVLCFIAAYLYFKHRRWF